ncbi:ZC2HC1B [Symbiodinium microadriaticum]|nr:ZC2HC1B [Symbiodinium microadriaticum]
MNGGLPGIRLPLRESTASAVRATSAPFEKHRTWRDVAGSKALEELGTSAPSSRAQVVASDQNGDEMLEQCQSWSFCRTEPARRKGTLEADLRALKTDPPSAPIVAEPRGIPSPRQGSPRPASPRPKPEAKPDTTRRLVEDGYPTPLTASQPTLTPSQARVPAKPGLNSGRSTPKSVEGLVGGSDDDGGPLIPCPDCGRSFKADSLERHKKICKKVFQQKRKQFNSAANRLGEFENASLLIENASKIERQKDAPKEVPDKVAKKEKSVPKWKAQSLAFRQAILAAKGSSDPEAAKKAAELQKEINAANLASGGNVMESDMVRCPHCGRTFNKEAGERHIAICLKTFGKKLGNRGQGGPGGKAGSSVTLSTGFQSEGQS